MYRVGFLLGATGQSVAPQFHALKEGLRERGYVEVRNIEFVQRYGDGRMERLPDLAAELVRLKVDVIVTGSNLHVTNGMGINALGRFDRRCFFRIRRTCLPPLRTGGRRD